MAPEDIDELRTLASALRAHTEWLVQSGATGLPAASSELVAERAAREPAAVARPASPAAPARAVVEPSPVVPEVRVVQPNAVVPSPRVESSAVELGTPDARKVRLELLAGEVSSCRRCRLHESRTQTVFARGTGSSGLCFIGEGPGADEDAQGYPFVGKAGQLLDRMIVAMGFDRDEVYVANIVKCRPPNNRKPEPDEMAECMPYLAEQLELLAPEAIVALGATAVQGLLGTSEGITRLRGRWRLYRGKIPVMPTFHPAYLLRTPAAKREVWEDLQAVLRQMGRPIPSRR